MVGIDPRDKDYAFDVCGFFSYGTLKYDSVTKYFHDHRLEILKEVLTAINENEPATHSFQHLQWDADITILKMLLDKYTGYG